MIVVTAPTSSIGRQVAQNLLDAGAPVRVIARDPARLTPSIRENAEVVRGSHGDPAVVAPAFADADAVFWLVPPDPRSDDVEAVWSGFTRTVIDAFQKQRVVGVSALGRGTPMADHAGYVTASLAMDDLIASTGVSYRALVMPSFMENMRRQTTSILNDGVFFAPSRPDLKVPTCATRDIAAAATRLLLDDSWSGVGSVPVLGPEDLSPDDQARILSEVLGRPVRFHQITGAAFKARLIGNGASEAMAQATLDMYEAKAAGLDNAEPRTPESSSPTTFREWCKEVFLAQDQTRV